MDQRTPSQPMMHAPPRAINPKMQSGRPPMMAGPPMLGGAPCGASLCAFPEPPLRSVYCMPAPYSSINGQKYSTLSYAYGAARPIM
jgi:hypothetical protein